ncbi:MAG: replicative DNA helicase, partial [Actinobacteria bacterium]|nr:replicative DNA helicase [Actinomycetota bacterium]
MSLAELPSYDDTRRSAPEFDRTPPQDLVAEQSVLGGMLLSKDAIGEVVEVLRSRDFYRPAHELIFDVIIDLYGHGEPADPAANAGYYAKIVRERAIARRLVEAGTKIVQLGYAAEGEVDSIVDMAEQEVYQVTERRVGEDFVQLNTLIPAALDQIEKIQSGELAEGVMTGFKDLDQLTNGFHPGNMIVIAARPAVGKSTLGLDIARHASIHNGDCSVIFSLEMSRSEITMRMLSAEARVALNNIRSGTLSDEEWSRLARRMGEINDAPLFIDDSANLSMMEIRAKARRLKQRHDLKLVVIDYLQLMTSGKRVENRQQEVSEFSRQLKLLAKELNVPVVAISQLNRSPEQRSDKKPLLSDLRESGSIEQDADVVILLHRDDL